MIFNLHQRFGVLCLAAYRFTENFTVVFI